MRSGVSLDRLDPISLPSGSFPLPFHANATTMRALGWPCACVWLPGRGTAQIFTQSIFVGTG
jgi:hypothetical protein